MPIDTHPELTEAQAALMGLARDFAQSRLAPGAAERDRSGAFPADLYKEAAEHGLLGVNLPERVLKNIFHVVLATDPAENK